MRELLFRGKSNNGKFVFGSYHQIIGLTTINDRQIDLNLHYILERRLPSDVGWYLQDSFKENAVDGKTVGQFSCYKDKNKVNIFEGDICKDRFGRIMSVVWWNGRLQWFCPDPANNFRYADLWQWLNKGKGFARNEVLLSVELIGNIHENKKLLKP